MKTKFKWILVSVMLAAVIAFAGCATTTDGPINFSSQAEADNAVALNQFYIISLVDLSVATAEEATDFNGSFNDILFFKSKQRLQKTRTAKATIYDPSTGFWSYDSTSGDSVSIHYKIKFTPRGTNGLPTTATTDMTYSADVSGRQSEETGPLTFHGNAAIDMTGIAAYRNATGNAALNGSFDFGIGIDEMQGLQTLSLDFVFGVTFNTLAISPTAAYPLQSGTIDFTLRFELTPSSPGFTNYFVGGTLTFDGTHIVKLAIGGFNYNIDLDTEIITPA